MECRNISSDDTCLHHHREHIRIDNIAEHHYHATAEYESAAGTHVQSPIGTVRRCRHRTRCSPRYADDLAQYGIGFLSAFLYWYMQSIDDVRELEFATPDLSSRIAVVVVVDTFCRD